MKSSDRPLIASYTLRSAVAEDFSFLRTLHRLTLKPHVEQIWGWDDAQQERLLRERFDPQKIQIIQADGRDVGVLQVERRPADIFLANILLLPEIQNHGFGSTIVKDLMKLAAESRLPLTLTVLKPNPARRLYERLGFVKIKEDDVRYYMKWNQE